MIDRVCRTRNSITEICIPVLAAQKYVNFRSKYIYIFEQIYQQSRGHVSATVELTNSLWILEEYIFFTRVLSGIYERDEGTAAAKRGTAQLLVLRNSNMDKLCKQ